MERSFEMSVFYRFSYWCLLIAVAAPRASRVGNSRRQSTASDTSGRHSPTPPSSHPALSPIAPSNGQIIMTPSGLRSSGGALKASFLTPGMNGLGIMERGREPLPPVIQEPEDQDDNWDADFEEGISLTKLQSLDRSIVDDEKSDENARTIRPTRSPSINGKVPLAVSPPPNITPIVEDYSDLASEEDAVFQGKVADFKLKNGSKRGLFHPKDIQTIGLGASPPAPRTAPLLDATPTSRPSPISRTLSGPKPQLHSRSSSFTGSMGRAEALRVVQSQEFDKYAEEDDEDYDDLFGKSTEPGTPGSGSEWLIYLCSFSSRACFTISETQHEAIR